jgi:hypothetical protein
MKRERERETIKEWGGPKHPLFFNAAIQGGPAGGDTWYLETRQYYIAARLPTCRWFQHFEPTLTPATEENAFSLVTKMSFIKWVISDYQSGWSSEVTAMLGIQTASADLGYQASLFEVLSRKHTLPPSLETWELEKGLKIILNGLSEPYLIWSWTLLLCFLGSEPNLICLKIHVINLIFAFTSIFLDFDDFVFNNWCLKFHILWSFLVR